MREETAPERALRAALATLEERTRERDDAVEGMAAADRAGAAAMERIAELEAGLVVCRRALNGGSEKAVTAARDWLAGNLDPTMTLDLLLDQVWKDGRRGKPHPCADSEDPWARGLAERSMREVGDGG